MPLNVRRFCTAATLAISSFVSISQAQTAPPPAPISPPSTSADMMRERVSKAKAYIAVRNYHAAIFELENVRKETNDSAVHDVVNVLLMNSYLEQGDYKRAQDLLAETYKQQKTTKPNASASYMAVAGQIVKGARSRVERFRALGLAVSDRTLPLEATTDLEKMRETLELVITQSKEIGSNEAKTIDAMMLLEEASSSRSMLARDDYDSRRWRDEVADTREQIINPRSVVISALGEPTTEAPNPNLVAENAKPPAATLVIIPVADTTSSTVPATTREREVKPNGQTVTAGPIVAQNDKPVNKPIIVPSAPPSVKEEPKKEAAKTEGVKKEEAKPVAEAPKTAAAADDSPLNVGSLLSYATNQAKPVYPNAARTMRTTGVVKVEVTVDENGEVAEVQKTSGPPMLQAAAQDAIRKWKFKPFTRDGQPVKATGFVSFNFSL